MLVKRSGARYFGEIKNVPLGCRHCPSVDVLFRLASRYRGKNGVGIHDGDGDGDDGARGKVKIKEAELLS